MKEHNPSAFYWSRERKSISYSVILRERSPSVLAVDNPDWIQQVGKSILSAKGEGSECSSKKKAKARIQTRAMKSASNRGGSSPSNQTSNS
jgi:hypothetical protein